MKIRFGTSLLVHVYVQFDIFFSRASGIVVGGTQRIRLIPQAVVS